MSTSPAWRARLLCVLACCAALVVVAACGSDDSGGSGGSTSAGSSASADSSKPVRVGVVGYANSNNYTQWAFYGAKKGAEENGAEVTLIDGKFDAKAQAAAMQNAIQSKKFDAFLLFPVDSGIMIPVVKQAQQEGLPVVTGEVLGTPEQSKKLQIVNPGVTATITASTVDQAADFVTNIKAGCTAKVGDGKPCKVAIMPGDRTFPVDLIKLKYVEDELKKDPNIKYVLTPDGHFAKPDGYKAATTFLQNNKDIDVFHANGDQMIFGVVQALKENGLTPGKDVLLTGFGGTSEGVAGIKDGTWFATVGLYPQLAGKVGVETIVKAIHKEPFEKLVDWGKLPGSQSIIDKQTLEQDPDYKADWSADGKPTG